jgi:ABC-type dipeptide/oligopeptide/nickel transport system permease subunit
LLGSLTGLLAGLSRLAEPLRIMMEALDGLPKLVVVLLLIAVFGAESYAWIGAPVFALLLMPATHAAVAARVAELTGARFLEAEVLSGVPLRRALLQSLLWNNLRGLVMSRLAASIAAIVLLDATCGYLQISQRESCAWGALACDNVQDWMRWSGLDSDFNGLAAIAPMLAIGAIVTSFASLARASRAAEAWRRGESSESS